MINWYTVSFIVLLVFLMIITTISLLHNRKQKKFVFSSDTATKINKLNAALTPTGFTYSLPDDMFHTRCDGPQRDFGYCHLYDEAMPLLGMIVDCEPIYFDYNNKHWLIEFWKGQYSMATGAQIGVFNTANEPINTPRFNGVFYESISDEECFPIEFTLRKNKKDFIYSKAMQGLLTGFKLAEFSNTTALTLDIKIIFPNKKMYYAFLNGLKNAGYSSKEFSAHFRTVKIRFTKPHTTQPVCRTRTQEALIQQGNETNCKTYHDLTSDYMDTLDKLEFLMTAFPDLYDKIIKTFYSKEQYTSFELIAPILKKYNSFNQSSITADES
ncbi:MAG: DUF4474 domain-containing protein [Lachnotalea sp.]